MTVRSNVRPVMTGSLRQMMARQAELQRALQEAQGNPVSVTSSNEVKIQYIKDMAFAAEDELHEALAEIGWKPWGTSRHINRNAFVSELVDTLQFIMNMLFVVGATAGEIEQKHYNKLIVNWRRLEERQAGGDGLGPKCRLCLRALDDEYTGCRPGFCVDYGEYEVTNHD